MRFRLSVLFVLVLASPSLSVGEDRASGKSGESESEEITTLITRYTEQPPGVYEPTFDKKGRLESCVVVGSARISTVLGESEGKLAAQKKAMIDVKRQFLLWLEDKADIRTNEENDTTILLEGDEEKNSESGKKVEKNTDSYKAVAEGVVRGLQGLGGRQIGGNTKTYVYVSGWTAETNQANKNLAKDEDEPKNGSTKNSNGKEGKTGPQIEDKTTIAPGAAKFFKKK